MTKKIDTSFDFGFTLVNSDELEEIQILEKNVQLTQAETVDVKNKLETMKAMIMALLNNLKQSPDRPYIYWPERVEKIDGFIKKLNEVIEG